MRKDTPEARAAFEIHKSIAAGTFPRMKEVTDLERLYSELVVRAGYEAWIDGDEPEIAPEIIEEMTGVIAPDQD